MDGVIVIDKPSGWTSMDVCAKLRGVFREKRVGHGGTLDPMATGVLPVFLGKATKAAFFSENAVKRYAAGIKLGVSTDTYDVTGRITAERPVSVSREDIEGVLPEFTGELDQTPPMYSAIKINGRKLYELARKGESVEVKPRRIKIYALALNAEGLLEVECSKGTYIRSLVNDIGERLGCGAAMSSLRRTGAGAFGIEDAVPLQRVIDASEEERTAMVRPVDSVFSEYPSYSVGGRRLELCLHGNQFRAPLPDGIYRIYSDEGVFLILGRAEDGVVNIERNFI